MESPGVKAKPIRRGELTLAGAIVVLSQLVTSHEETRAIRDDIARLQAQLNQSELEREKFFERKIDVAPYFEEIRKLNLRVTKLSEEFHRLQKEIWEEEQCSLQPEETLWAYSK